jgi:hypothetical protein
MMHFDQQAVKDLEFDVIRLLRAALCALTHGRFAAYTRFSQASR